MRKIKQKIYSKISKLNRRLVKKKDNQESIDRKIKPKIFKVPENFSIVNNSEKVIKFFNSIERYIDFISKQTRIQLEFSNVKKITVDALLYLLAIIQNIKNDGYITSFGGNAPTDTVARKILLDSGFLEHIRRSPENDLEWDSDRISIRSGKRTDSKLIGEICEFIHKNSTINRIDTKFLFTIIGEMMTNSFEHAYPKNNKNAQNWLLYVERNDSKFKFMFLDTGFGIVNTVRKKISEKMGLVKEIDILESTFYTGDRSKTKHTYRGKGLPRIYDSFRTNNLIQLDIITNKACMILNRSNENDSKISLNSNLKGTLYYWEIDS